MNIERLLRIIAGVFITFSVVMSHFHSPYWLLFTIFIGLNLFQSGFTNWCPMMTILDKMGIKPCKDKIRTKE